MVKPVILVEPFLTTGLAFKSALKLGMISSAPVMVNSRMIASGTPRSARNIIFDTNQNTVPHIRVLAIKTMVLPVVPKAWLLADSIVFLFYTI